MKTLLSISLVLMFISTNLVAEYGYSSSSEAFRQQQARERYAQQQRDEAFRQQQARERYAQQQRDEAFRQQQARERYAQQQREEAYRREQTRQRYLEQQRRDEANRRIQQEQTRQRYAEQQRQDEYNRQVRAEQARQRYAEQQRQDAIRRQQSIDANQKRIAEEQERNNKRIRDNIEKNNAKQRAISAYYQEKNRLVSQGVSASQARSILISQFGGDPTGSYYNPPRRYYSDSSSRSITSSNYSSPSVRSSQPYTRVVTPEVVRLPEPNIINQITVKCHSQATLFINGYTVGGLGKTRNYNVSQLRQKGDTFKAKIRVELTKDGNRYSRETEFTLRYGHLRTVNLEFTENHTKIENLYRIALEDRKKASKSDKTRWFDNLVNSNYEPRKNSFDTWVESSDELLSSIKDEKLNKKYAREFEDEKKERKQKLEALKSMLSVELARQSEFTNNWFVKVERAYDRGGEPEADRMETSLEPDLQIEFKERDLFKSMFEQARSEYDAKVVAFSSIKSRINLDVAVGKYRNSIARWKIDRVTQAKEWGDSKREKLFEKEDQIESWYVDSVKKAKGTEDKEVAKYVLELIQAKYEALNKVAREIEGDIDEEENRRGNLFGSELGEQYISWRQSGKSVSEINKLHLKPWGIENKKRKTKEAIVDGRISEFVLAYSNIGDQTSLLRTAKRKQENRDEIKKWAELAIAKVDQTYSDQLKRIELAVASSQKDWITDEKREISKIPDQSLREAIVAAFDQEKLFREKPKKSALEKLNEYKQKALKRISKAKEERLAQNEAASLNPERIVFDQTQFVEEVVGELIESSSEQLSLALKPTKSADYIGAANIARLGSQLEDVLIGKYASFENWDALIEKKYETDLHSAFGKWIESKAKVKKEITDPKAQVEFAKLIDKERIRRESEINAIIKLRTQLSRKKRATISSVLTDYIRISQEGKEVKDVSSYVDQYLKNNFEKLNNDEKELEERRRAYLKSIEAFKEPIVAKADVDSTVKIPSLPKECLVNFRLGNRKPSGFSIFFVEDKEQKILLEFETLDAIEEVSCLGNTLAVLGRGAIVNEDVAIDLAGTENMTADLIFEKNKETTIHLFQESTLIFAFKPEEEKSKIDRLWINESSFVFQLVAEDSMSEWMELSVDGETLETIKVGSVPQSKVELFDRAEK